MKFKVKLSILSVFVFVVSACTFSEQKERGEKEDVFICDVEVIDAEKWRFTEALKKDIYFQNVESQSEDFAYSGKFSSKLFPGNPFGLTTDITNVKPDDYIQITAWRKSENQNGVIAIDGGEGFYNAGKYVIEKSENGWEKIFLEYFVPPNFYSGKVKVYLWNNSSDTVYFDDFQIVHRNNKKYPDYADVKGLQMHMDQLDLNRLGKKRLSAFETTVLVNSDEDYSSLVLFDGVDFLNGDFRLKGDLVDHLQGQKWSFRVKLKKEFAWKNMRTFSIQNPLTRSFLNEWLAHKIFEQEDILTTRYGFVTVKINKQSLGIYAWEEHFEKHLVESKNRREGPIVRFDETLFWQRVLETNSTKQNWDIDFFGASKILPFKVTRTVADTSLSAQFNEAQKLVFQYKNREKPVSEIFDIDKLAAYYALIDLTQAYHGFTWHNQRFYYNPVTCLLEPIAFDGYIESGIYKRIDEQVTGLLNPDKIKTFNKEELMLYQVFADSVFNKKYVQFLKEYSDSQFIENLISRYKPEADSLSELIKREFPYYEFNFNILKWQADYIRKNYIQIETNIEKLGVVVSAVNNEKFRKNYTSDINKNLIPFQVQAFYNKNKKQVEVLNYTNSPIKILGAFMSERLPESFDPRLELEAYNGIAASRISIPIEGNPLKILFSVENEMFETEVSQWNVPEGLTHRQKLNEIGNIEQLTIVNGKVIFDGEYRFENDVVIPPSMQVLIKPGTKIDLVNMAGFFSFSHVNCEGTESNPVKITSTDKSANGFNILQTGSRSQLNFVHFSGLSNLRKGGWQTPSAITFYEADVNLENCIFANNSNCDDALNVVRSDFLVSNCRFENTFADAFDSDFCTGTVINCVFQNTGNDAIDFSGSQVNIEDCKMINISDKAISGGENSTLNVSNCEIVKANIGVAGKDLSTLKLDKITMEQTVYGLVAFVKKPEYGPANIIIDNLKMKNNMVFHQIELGSVLTLNGKTIHGNEKNLAIKLYQ